MTFFRPKWSQGHHMTDGGWKTGITAFVVKFILLTYGIFTIIRILVLYLSCTTRWSIFSNIQRRSTCSRDTFTKSFQQARYFLERAHGAFTLLRRWVWLISRNTLWTNWGRVCGRLLNSAMTSFENCGNRTDTSNWDSCSASKSSYTHKLSRVWTQCW